MDVPVHGGDLQPGADAEPGDGGKPVNTSEDHVAWRNRGPERGTPAGRSADRRATAASRIVQGKPFLSNWRVFPHPANDLADDLSRRAIPCRFRRRRIYCRVHEYRLAMSERDNPSVW
jgi:hypothetical protein